MRSGTTYLSALLARHPAVFMSSPREPCYFVDQSTLRQAWPEMWARGYWRSMDRYLSLFAGAGDASVIAEASNSYSQVPMFTGVPERILSFSPGARFMYIMRDPVERTISHYWHRVRWSGENRPMLAAIRFDRQYTEVSYYAKQLQTYLRHVGPERIYALTLEALMADPAGQLGSIYAWLGVQSSFRPPDLGVPANARPARLFRVPGYGLLCSIRQTPSYSRIAPFVPSPLRTLGSRLAFRSASSAEVSAAETKSYLRSHQLTQTDELSRLLNRAFPEWHTLYESA